VISAEFQQLTSPIDAFDARPAVAYLLRRARELGASDLHLSPREQSVEIALRQDGVLRRQGELDSAVYGRLLVGLKNMARLASYKKSLPQDGAMQLEGLEVRVATAPTVFGERAVLRLLGHTARPPELDRLGFFPAELKALRDLADRPQGLVLATGPAGSGKTTTLLAMMRWLYATHRARMSDPRASLSVVTLEDPVEMVVPEFHQTAIASAGGMTFAEGLRSMLRQDPEVVLVGEIRDPETARAAVQAGLSGHLVFSTLHAKDAVGVVPRLLEMGVEPYQLSAALAGVVSQRLVRRLCPSCQGQAGKECAACQGSGYQGRTAIAEILTLDDDLAQLILDRAPLRTLRGSALEKGMQSLAEAARSRLENRVTDAVELARIVPEWTRSAAKPKSP
jgi:type II secretory ATPase GspE/PulE/Tfp pilus assembly ATPase PilB-like protein